MADEKANAKPANGVWSSVKPFVYGGASSMIPILVIQPLDMIKVRTQLGQKCILEVTKNIYKHDGLIDGFYKGLTAGLLRQAIYTTARLGTYKFLTDKLAKSDDDGNPPPFFKRVVCGLTVGAIGGILGTPADLALVRLQAEPTLPASQRRNYKNAYDALKQIYKKEGKLALWKGAGPTVTKAAVLNSIMFGFYHPLEKRLSDKDGCLKLGEISAVLCGVGFSGLLASLCSLPVDYVKTQIQNMQHDANRKRPYTSSLDCAMKTWSSDGLAKFYGGFSAYYVRTAGHVLMAWGILYGVRRMGL